MSNDSNAKCVMIKLLDAALFYNIGRHGNVGKCKQPWQYFFKSLKVVPMYLKNIEDWIGWNHVKYYFNLLKSIGNKKTFSKHANEMYYIKQDGRPGPVVMEGDSCLRGREFESLTSF